MAKDLFSKQSSAYAGFRPGYPAELVQHILAHTHGREAAWDCATGNGQAAVLLAPHFNRIYATDLSRNQLNYAFDAPNIEYSEGTAETSGLPSNVVQLITVAQAYHWFDHRQFHLEALRVGMPGATIAVWGYGIMEISNAKLNDELLHLYSEILGEFWPKERIHFEQQYKSLPFPYEELPSLNMSMTYEWNRPALVGYLESWSAVQRFKEIRQTDPVAEWIAPIERLIPESFTVKFPLFLKLGRLPGA